jgi:hypothetical protein
VAVHNVKIFNPVITLCVAVSDWNVIKQNGTFYEIPSVGIILFPCDERKFSRHPRVLADDDSSLLLA